MAKSKKGKRLSMRKIREILRLGMKGDLSRRQIARSCGVSRPAVSTYLDRVQTSGHAYEEIEKMTDQEITALMKPQTVSKSESGKPQADWKWVHQEMKKKGVTLALLWNEYKDEYPEGYQYTQYCAYYKGWIRKLAVSLRQSYKAGEKMFVDYAGHTIPVVDPKTGYTRDAQIFVAVLGASNYTYVEATWDQSLESWIDSHVHAFEYFNGVTEIVVPDNLRSGVSKACRYEPDLNPTYHEMAVHYGTVIMPTRVRKPKDKAKVEAGVLVVERWILASLRNQTFFSLHELNSAIRELLVKLNERAFKKLDGSRKSWFEGMERPQLKLLPLKRYVFGRWKKVAVNIDYHVDIEGHYYSVPHPLGGQHVMVKYTAQTVQILHHGKRVASHIRSHRRGAHTTQTNHMPKNHQEYLEWSPSRIIRWAGTVGEQTQKAAQTILQSREHPEQGYRSCLGVLRLGKRYGEDRLERACARAITIGSCRYKSIRSILEKGLDKAPVVMVETSELPIQHENIRGRSYYA